MFIDFEGIDGSGKTTLSNLLARQLRRLGHRVTHAREGGELKAPIARRLRELTRDPSLLEMTARTEFFLNVARDAQQLEEVVKPSLAQGDVVITDRFLYSQLAHSGAGRGLPSAELMPVVELAAQGLWPDLVVLVDVDPELARLRKRLSKSGRGELETGSRKGLAGAGLGVRMRDAFLGMARTDPSRWLVIENDDQPLQALAEKILEVVRARLEDREPEIVLLGSGAPTATPATLETLESAFFDAVDRLELREPELAAFLLTGVPGLAAHQRRLRFVELSPRLVARSLNGLGDEASFELRRVLARLSPMEVALSLGTDASPRAMAMRLELFDRAPGPVVQGLKRNDSSEAWALRELALMEAELEPVLLGLGGVHSERAWTLREEGLRRGLVAATARSLTEVQGERADELRSVLFPRDRLAVLKSTQGTDSDYARELRELLFERAPRAVLRSLSGLDAPYAWGMRTAQVRWTKEALDSVDGMDQPEAWWLRERNASLWPSTALSSLRELANSPRGAALVERVLRENPGRLPVLRNAWVTTARARLAAPSSPAPKPQQKPQPAQWPAERKEIP